MIKVENILVSNFEGAIRGMRNPLNSWKKMDSTFEPDNVILGPNDLALAQRLIKAGTDHSKFIRQIFVSMDITAPLYWWKEMDTYKVGTIANSTSTMHKIASTPLTKDLFSFDDELEFLKIDERRDNGYEMIVFDDVVDELVYTLELIRRLYVQTQNKNYWRALIQLLPCGWNQMRTWTANYQVLRNIYFARKDHKLSEWHTFCEEIEKLPYAKELITLEKKDD